MGKMSTGGDLVIRSLEMSDLEGWAALRNCPHVQRHTLAVPYASSDSSRRILEQGLDTRRTLVAVTDGQIVGAASLESMRQRRAHVGQVGVMVHDDYTRRGIGSRLMTAILDIADNWLNLHRLELQVYTHNQEAIHLYQRFGFEIEGTLRDYAYGEGRYLDAYTMARLRSTPA